MSICSSAWHESKLKDKAEVQLDGLNVVISIINIYKCSAMREDSKSTKVI